MVCSDHYHEVYIDGKRVASNALNVTSYVSVPSITRVIAIQVTNIVGPGGFRAAFTDNSVVTDGSWKCSSTFISEWQNVDFDDSLWSAPTTVRTSSACSDFSSSVKWLRASKYSKNSTSTIYCRKSLSKILFIIYIYNIVMHYIIKLLANISDLVNTLCYFITVLQNILCKILQTYI